MSGTWGAPILPSGLDQFTGKQEPDPRPVDDLSEFVMARIRTAEKDPVVDGVPGMYAKPGGAITHRYAGNVRRDMVVFRRIVAEYCAWLPEEEAAKAHGASDLWAAHRDGLLGSVTAILYELPPGERPVSWLDIPSLDLEMCINWARAHNCPRGD